MSSRPVIYPCFQRRFSPRLVASVASPREFVYAIRDVLRAAGKDGVTTEQISVATRFPRQDIEEFLLDTMMTSKTLDREKSGEWVLLPAT